MRVINIIFHPAIIAIMALFLSVIWMLRDQKDKTRVHLVFALVLNLFYGVLLNILMGHEGSLFPLKFDRVLLHIDQTIGIPAPLIASHLQGALRIPLWIIYQLMVPMMIVWFLITRYRRSSGSIILAYVAELVSGPLIYAIVPACGPIYAFGKEWLHPPAVPADAIPLAGIPNAFPSLHVGTAFLFVLFAPGKFWKAVALLFLAGTCFATLSTGEHYVIDLVPGLAFGAFAASVGIKKTRRAAGYLALVLAWSLVVRFAYSFLIAHPIVTRSFALATVALVALALVQQWFNAPAREEIASVAA
jgi:PAP2 superfamily